MTQREYDALMIAINREQSEMHRVYDAKQQDLNDRVADLDKQILDLKKQIVDVNREKSRVASERFRLDMEFRQRKHELAVDHPKDTMEPESKAPQGHAIQEEAV